MNAPIDTLAIMQHLESAGIPRDHAVAHAETIREHVMPEIATKADITELKSLIERQTLVITIWLGGLVIVATGALAAFIKLL